MVTRPTPGSAPGLALCWEHAREFGDGARFEFGPLEPDPAFARWWLDAARPGDSLRYYTGPGLAEAARGDRDVAELAGLLLAEASVVTRRMSGCRHWRGNARGRGRVALVQRRDGPGAIDYLAVRVREGAAR